MDQRQLQRQKQEQISINQQQQIEQQQYSQAQPMQAQKKASSGDAAPGGKEERLLRRRVRSMGDFIKNNAAPVEVKGCAAGETAPPAETSISRMGMFDAVCDWYKASNAF